MYNNTSQVSNFMPFSAATPSMMQRQPNPGMARPMMQRQPNPGMARPMMQRQPNPGMASPMFMPQTLPQMAQSIYSVPSIPSIPGISMTPMPFQGNMALPQYATTFYTGLTPNPMV